MCAYEHAHRQIAGQAGNNDTPSIAGSPATARMPANSRNASNSSPRMKISKNYTEVLRASIAGLYIFYVLAEPLELM